MNELEKYRQIISNINEDIKDINEEIKELENNSIVMYYLYLKQELKLQKRKLILTKRNDIEKMYNCNHVYVVDSIEEEKYHCLCCGLTNDFEKLSENDRKIHRDCIKQTVRKGTLITRYDISIEEITCIYEDLIRNNPIIKQEEIIECLRKYIRNKVFTLK